MRHLLIIPILILSTSNLFAQDVKLERIRQLSISKADSLFLFNTWKQLTQALRNSDFNKLKKISLPTVECSFCDKFETLFDQHQFVPVITYATQFDKVIKKTALWDAILSGEGKLTTILFEDKHPLSFKLPAGQKLIIYQIFFDVREPSSLNKLARSRGHYFNLSNATATFSFMGFIPHKAYGSG